MPSVSRIQELIEYLNYHTELYDTCQPCISDAEWDEKYFELKKLEEESGIIFYNSPTQTVHYNVVNSLNKVRHNHQMLSLDKTKEAKEIFNYFLDDSQAYLVMCKMDGLTCSLMYEDGKLISAETRGDGETGEDILHNAKVIKSIPQSIPYEGRLIVDGEIICRKNDFEKFAKDYKNPRNFAAGSIRLLEAIECEKRNLTFVAWDVIEGIEDHDSLSFKLNNLDDWGFITVPRIRRIESSIDIIEKDIEYMAEIANKFNYPIDGVVFKFDDIEYGRSLGNTGHHFKNAIAYKFADELYETELINIEWSMGRTGILSPVAIFKPIDIDGSTVERASLHNISIINEIFGEAGPAVGQKIEVFKANMIIPQIKSAKKIDYDDAIYLETPDICPICGGETEIRRDISSTFLACTNPACSGKLINRLDHFCGKKGLDIKGLSKATLEKLIDWGWVSSFSDLFQLAYHTNDWTNKAGFGQKSVMNILTAIDEGSICNLDKFIAALGIPLIGSTASKTLVKYYPTWEAFRYAIDQNEDFTKIDGFGYEMNKAIHSYNYTEADILVECYISFNETVESSNENILDGKIFVITGKLSHFKNRDALKELIESLGGKVTGSVSKNTNFLINNDVQSTSSKNATAIKLGIPVLSEKDFLTTFKILD